ncbi:ankyrin repeat-containing domain protein [Morchella snyderi]|nr:ankyrin repeat-containing domain protein [Morchella snyderi]
MSSTRFPVVKVKVVLSDLGPFERERMISNQQSLLTPAAPQRSPSGTDKSTTKMKRKFNEHREPGLGRSMSKVPLDGLLIPDSTLPPPEKKIRIDSVPTVQPTRNRTDKSTTKMKRKFDEHREPGLGRSMSKVPLDGPPPPEKKIRIDSVPTVQPTRNRKGHQEENKEARRRGRSMSKEPPPNKKDSVPNVQPTRKRKGHPENMSPEPKRYQPSISITARTGNVRLTLLGPLLMAAVRDNDINTVHRVLSFGTDPNYKHRKCDGQTAMHIVTSKEMVKLLISAGADINSRDYKGRTPLHMAIKAFWYPVTKVLLAQGNIDIGATTYSQQWTPLHYAAEYSTTCVIDILERERELREMGAEMLSKRQDCFGSTPLHIFVRSLARDTFSYEQCVTELQNKSKEISMKSSGDMFFEGLCFQDSLGCAPMDYVFDKEDRHVNGWERKSMTALFDERYEVLRYVVL